MYHLQDTLLLEAMFQQWLSAMHVEEREGDRRGFISRLRTIIA